MDSPYKPAHLQSQVVIQISNKRGQQPQDSLRTGNLNSSSNKCNNRMVWAQTLKPTKTTGSKYTYNKTNKTEINKTTLNYPRTRTIIRKWDWVLKIIRRDWLSMIKASNNRMDNHLKDIQP